MNRWATFIRPLCGLEGRTHTRSALDGLFPLFSFCRYNEPTCEQALHISNPLIANANPGLRFG